MNETTFMYDDDNASIFLAGEMPRSINRTHANYSVVVEQLKLKPANIEKAYELANPAFAIKKFGIGKVEVVGDSVYYGELELHGTIVTRILTMLKEGFNIDHMLKFLDNIMLNPSYKSTNDLYRFLDSNKMPITMDGRFLAYKNVRDNYMDRHTGTFDNHIGKVCVMPRNQVEDDPNKTCSTGLHFCSMAYLDNFWGRSGHTMVVAINPAHVVSVPTDYKDSKGRCSEYEVVNEIKSDRDVLSDSSVYDTDADDWDYYNSKHFDDVDDDDLDF